jgi:serine/threonine protein kinase
MARDATDPADANTPIPLEGDGHELIGQVIDGRYRLEATLGRGGMGLVYRANHIGLRRSVAVKILHPSLAASPEVRNRFEREALAVGKIEHPNCVAVYDVGRLHDGALYLAMELLDGKPLADVLENEGQIAPGRALHILAGILRGLGHIHQAGLIHRDIKPENIFLIRHEADVDFAKILDFGIAKPMDGSDLDDSVRLTQAGMAFGTPIYMAPEQALGNPMDGRADLYAASVLAYEMLCGQPPFYSDDKLEVMSMHTARPVPPMRQRLIKGARPVPSSLEKLITRGLTKKPQDRWANAEVYLAAVEDALESPDGGVTDVTFERIDTTGSQPLVTADGQVRITGSTDFASEDPSEAINDAIDEALADVQTQVSIKPFGLDVTPLPKKLAAPRAESPRSLGGGVGLGLPYTGPSGEPIFGLTPEQRLAREPRAGFANDVSMASALEPDADKRLQTVLPRVRKRWPLYAFIAGLATILGIVVALATLPHGKPEGLDPATPAGAANAALKEGDANRALQILDGAKNEIANDPQGQMVLGRAHAARNERLEALAAFRHALELAPELEADQDLRANLRAMAADRTADVVGQAFELWAGKTTDPEAKTAIVKAVVSDDMARRHAVLPVVDKLDIKGVDLLAAYSLDLEQQTTCEKRREAIAKLRALGDVRAVPVLERATVRKPRQGKRPPPPFPNACLVDDANAAIGYLRGLGGH